MPVYNVKVKWRIRRLQSESDTFELDPDENPKVFIRNVYLQTGVLPVHQQMMFRCEYVTNKMEFNKYTIADGHTFRLLPHTSHVYETPPRPAWFNKNMTDEEIAEVVRLPFGLENLGNTCYMNATLLCLRVIPELHQALDAYSGGRNTEDARAKLIVSLRDLYQDLGKEEMPIRPVEFWQSLCNVFPQYTQTGQDGVHLQHDAKECWDRLLSVLRDTLPADEQTGKNFVEQYMTGLLQSESKCADIPWEKSEMTTRSFTKLVCSITPDNGAEFFIEKMADCLKKSLQEEFTQYSPTLKANAQYERLSKISRLPRYLVVQFQRFHGDVRIFHKVKFPLYFDASELCVPELKNKFRKLKLKAKETDEARRAKYKADMRRRVNLNINEQARAGVPPEIEPDDKVDWSQYMDDGPVDDPTSNPTALYELCAVLSHVGPSPDSGRYLAWVKKANEQWHKYYDDKVTLVTDWNIRRLSGGGDWHTAHILLYRTRRFE